MLQLRERIVHRHHWDGTSSHHPLVVVSLPCCGIVDDPLHPDGFEWMALRRNWRIMFNYPRLWIAGGQARISVPVQGRMRNDHAPGSVRNSP